MKKLITALLFSFMFALVFPISAHADELYVLYNANTKEYLYTVDTNEEISLWNTGWENRGSVCDLPSVSSTPIYRLCNPFNATHLYTADLNEVSTLVNSGWINEGIAFYSDDKTTEPVYRTYNPVTGEHQFSGMDGYVSYLETHGWINEGIAFYSLATIYDDRNYRAPGDTNREVEAYLYEYSNQKKQLSDEAWAGPDIIYNGVELTKQNALALFDQSGMTKSFFPSYFTKECYQDYSFSSGPDLVSVTFRESNTPKNEPDIIEFGDAADRQWHAEGEYQIPNINVTFRGLKLGAKRTDVVKAFGGADCSGYSLKYFSRGFDDKSITFQFEKQNGDWVLTGTKVTYK